MSKLVNAKNDTLCGVIFNKCKEAIVITDAETNIVQVNNAFTHITGYTATDVIGKNPRILSSGIQNAEFYRELWETINATGSWQGEIWNKKKNGEIYPEWLSITALLDDDQNVMSYVAIFHDIGNFKRTIEHLDYLLSFDDLTNLPNHNKFISIISNELAKKHQLALLFIDINRFKNINVTAGHAVGDMVLREVAARLQDVVIHHPAIVCRYGSDEFIISISGIKGDADIIRFADMVIAAIEQPLIVDNFYFNPSASIGISTFPEDGDTVDELIKNADTALSVAKKNLTEKYAFYSSNQSHSIIRRVDLEAQLHTAITNNEFEIYLQPKTLMDGKTLVGAEALIRWNKNDFVMLPGDFIPLAEEIGLIAQLGGWVTRNVCQIYKQFVEKFKNLPNNFRIAINVSTEQLKKRDEVITFNDIARRLELNPDFDSCKLDFEVTESMLMSDPAYTISLLKILQEHGVNISIDDFGTGYSSLSYIKHLPVNALKIDQSFVRDIDIKNDSAPIVKTIITLAKNMNLQVIAEGVETEEQREFLERAGCDVMQGYLVSKPITVAEFETNFLEKYK